MPTRIETTQIKTCRRCHYMGTNFPPKLNGTLCRTCKNKAISHAPIKISTCKVCGYVGTDFPNGVRSRCTKCRNEYCKLFDLKSIMIDPLSVRLRNMKSHLKNKFGLTIEDYMSMFNKQSGQCIICGVKPEEYTGTSKKHKTLHVDHDHITNKVRGLLCHDCNVGLGSFRDNIQNLANAMSYLQG